MAVGIGDGRGAGRVAKAGLISEGIFLPVETVVTGVVVKGAGVAPGDV